MYFIVLLSCLALAVTEQPVDDDWIDPYDMLNYDAVSKSMRKPAESSNYPNVPTKRRGYSENSEEPSQCTRRVEILQKQNENQQKTITQLSQQPTCNPVFKRFLSRLIKEIERVGLPTDSTDSLYDAQIKVSKQTLAEIRALLDGEESWRTGALDNAISQILTDLRPHDYEAWVWRFEHTFGVEMDTVVMIALCVLMIVAIISTELWSTISWFVQFKRLFAVCFMISIVWNWFYLYKIAFAEHQNNLVKMDDFNQKCTGVKKIDWSDSLKEWFRNTWTLQDDPCKQYYEVLMVNPILLVPPTKAISVTITTFITEPLKHFGKGISEFLRALLKDLPVQLQIPVLLTIVLAILVVMYGGVNAAFQHGITAPFRRPHRDPHDRLEPPPERNVPRIEGGGDAPNYEPPPRPHWGNGNGGGDRGRNQLRQRPMNRGLEQRQKITVHTLGNMDHNRDEIDADLNEGHLDSERSISQLIVEAESAGNVEQAEVNKTQPKTKETLNKEPPGASNEVTEARAPPNTVEEKSASMHEPPQMKGAVDKQDAAEKDPSPDVLPQIIRRIESIGHPVQETSPDATP
ncbi:chloride channel CLIC-like protein 1 [Periophthalmus magnuspinnatus]|uniref:chloride channel CLIC-like protein 1 n=1 Tax=Periophthalmus magnuspinnatus TaxID=409849 RepID=UPI00145B90CE|nr:chloride channel CLIC-like protein 1 [Periophthalmus magnuspinnatus]